MIPHAPPMRFEVGATPDEGVVLPAEHPLARAGVYSPWALVELAAQLAGRSLAAPGGHAGMLVEVDALRILGGPVPAGTRLRPRISPERSFGGLHRVEVELPGVLEARLTLRVT